MCIQAVKLVTDRSSMNRKAIYSLALRKFGKQLKMEDDSSQWQILPRGKFVITMLMFHRCQHLLVIVLLMHKALCNQEAAGIMQKSVFNPSTRMLMGFNLEEWLHTAVEQLLDTYEHPHCCLGSRVWVLRAHTSLNRIKLIVYCLLRAKITRDILSARSGKENGKAELVIRLLYSSCFYNLI